VEDGGERSGFNGAEQSVRLIGDVERVLFRCPLWDKTRHDALKMQCPLYRRKRTLLGDSWMSALYHFRAHALQQMIAYSITS
jgi:hypothetical protein